MTDIDFAAWMAASSALAATLPVWAVTASDKYLLLSVSLALEVLQELGSPGAAYVGYNLMTIEV